MSGQVLGFATTRAAFEAAIDRRWDASQSVVLRYRGACSFGGGGEERFRELLGETSLREGLRIVPLLRYRDVAVDVLDSSSRMHTHTHKSVDGCVTTARCLLRGQRRIVFESGGNTGTALTAYATRAGIETFLFLPADNLPLLDAVLFEHPKAHLIAVDDAREVKPAAAAFAARHRLARVPEVAWRHQAASFIGCFVLEELLGGARYDHFVQGISAAFAPIGIYRVLEPFREALGGLPRFLGVQQADNCPMLRAWKGADAAPLPLPTTSGLLAKVMYDGAPQTYGTYEELRQLLGVATGTSRASMARPSRNGSEASSMVGRRSSSLRARTS